MNFDSMNQILDFAIEREQEAAAFYTGLADGSEHKHMKEIFLGFAAEERGHEAKLKAVKDGKQMVSAEKRVLDLKIGDNLAKVEMKPNLDYQDALILAMKAEKAAFRLYSDLAAATDDANLRTLFLGLAQEEAKHKLRFEIEYDDHILTDN